MHKLYSLQTLLIALPHYNTYKIRGTYCHVGCAWPISKWKMHWLWFEGTGGGMEKGV